MAKQAQRAQVHARLCLQHGVRSPKSESVILTKSYVCQDQFPPLMIRVNWASGLQTALKSSVHECRQCPQERLIVGYAALSTGATSNLRHLGQVQLTTSAPCNVLQERHEPLPPVVAHGDKASTPLGLLVLEYEKHRPMSHS